MKRLLKLVTCAATLACVALPTAASAQYGYGSGYGSRYRGGGDDAVNACARFAQRYGGRVRITDVDRRGYDRLRVHGVIVPLVVRPRPGGLAADVVSCADGCGSIDTFGGTDAGAWVAQNGWQYGFIVRYVAGETPVTGYDPEPWHLRYVGVSLATAYHDGGYGSLEQFFGLPAAPAYPG